MAHAKIPLSVPKQLVSNDSQVLDRDRVGQGRPGAALGCLADPEGIGSVGVVHIAIGSGVDTNDVHTLANAGHNHSRLAQPSAARSPEAIVAAGAAVLGVGH